MRRLNERYGDDARLELHEYQTLGRLEGAVRSQADLAIQVNSLSIDQLEALRTAFVPALVRATANGEFVRQPALYDQIDAQARPQIDQLINAHLLTTRTNGIGQTVVEIAHEALLRVWPLLEGWVAEDGDRLREIEAVKRAAAQWRARKQHEDFLLHRGERLKDIEAIKVDSRLGRDLEEAERDYLQACRKGENREIEAERVAAERELKAAQDLAEEQRLRAEAQQALASRRKWQSRAASVTSALLLMLLVFRWLAMVG